MQPRLLLGRRVVSRLSVVYRRSVIYRATGSVNSWGNIHGCVVNDRRCVNRGMVNRRGRMDGGMDRGFMNGWRCVHGSMVHGRGRVYGSLMNN
jgi:hypothetical protein